MPFFSGKDQRNLLTQELQGYPFIPLKMGSDLPL
jgi:hypothetical protein